MASYSIGRRTNQSDSSLAARMGVWGNGHWKTATPGWMAVMVRAAVAAMS
jgi:hypothetical protein